MHCAPLPSLHRQSSAFGIHCLLRSIRLAISSFRCLFSPLCRRAMLYFQLIRLSLSSLLGISSPLGATLTPRRHFAIFRCRILSISTHFINKYIHRSTALIRILSAFRFASFSDGNLFAAPRANTFRSSAIISWIRRSLFAIE